jgi:DNA mismatch repair protein MutS2
MTGHDVVFVLHGHGTGAMKQAVRRALPQSSYVGKVAPANEDQGGDAFTVAELRPR